MTHPVKIPRNALRVPPAYKLPDRGRETWAWIIGQGFPYYISDSSPLWFADGYMYAWRLPVRHPDPRPNDPVRDYQMNADRTGFRLRLVGYPVRGLPPILDPKATR